MNNISKKALTLTAYKFIKTGTDSNTLNLFIALTKPATLSLIIEKATELGAASIQLVATQYCQSREINLEKLTKIAISATEQCGRLDYPIIKAPQVLAKIANEHHKMIVGTVNAGCSLKTLSAYNCNNWLIGPEGGFSQTEGELFKEKNYLLFTLGHNILRSETAAIAAAVTHSLINQ
ncbi:MAG: RsmE family RNA methyltransferase [Pseudomonadota bacterium]